jgi:hypothetical protein
MSDAEAKPKFDEDAVLEQAALFCFGSRDAKEAVSRNFVKIAKWQFNRNSAVIESLTELLEHQQRTIAVMGHDLLCKGVNFDFAAVDERWKALKEFENERR